MAKNKQIDRRESLEQKKLTEEIKEIRDRNLLSGKTAKHSEIRNWITLVGGLLTALGGITTLAIQWTNYADQRKEETAFKVNSEVIALVNQLNDTMEFKRKSAVILLSLYGKNAVPILIHQLDVPAQSNGYASSSVIIESLLKIAQNDNGKLEDLVIDEIIKESNSVFERELKNLNSITALENFSQALCYMRPFQTDKVDAERRKLIDDIPKSSKAKYLKEIKAGLNSCSSQ